MTLENRIREHIAFLYGEGKSGAIWKRLNQIIENFRDNNPNLNNQSRQTSRLSERDSILITYGDQVRESGRPPLQSLAEFLHEHLQGVISSVHILPFFPYSSDDGFSIIDYKAVNPDFGSWEDVARLNRNFRLMFDAVINHISVESRWFQGFLGGDPKYEDYFITVESNADLSQVVRPRALPLLTEFETSSGVKSVWTTFSEDQVDLNYHDPDVLLEIVDTLLFYVTHGAEFIRLDAIAYLWKEIGTSCIHLPQTHRVIQLFRDVLNLAAPFVMLITETNVPHPDNISYFGDGKNEAQMVYNFALPPLVLHTLHTGDATTLSEWAAGLKPPSDQTTFFNFLASHDGVGINPARGILTEDEIQALIQRVRAYGGLVSNKQNPDGTQSPYELNINYFDALSNPGGDDPVQVQIDRFICAHAIMLSLVGVPGIYFHSMFGSRGWPEGVVQTGRNRTINRQKLMREELTRGLTGQDHIRQGVFRQMSQLLKARGDHPAFDPHGGQRVVEFNQSIFAVLRISPLDGEQVLCLHNVSVREQRVICDFTSYKARAAEDLLSHKMTFDNSSSLELRPYQVLWLNLIA
jgi:glycosidase